VVTSVCAQSTTIAVVSIMVGVPLGIVVGRVAWNALVDSIGAVAEPVFPAVGALLVPVLVVFAALIGVVPGRWAARARPATVLRAE
jgi:predicted lysophospholipase L1 biosynthesis ABC-type transport system permease subunit